MDSFHQVRESMSQLESAPGAGHPEPVPGEWEVGGQCEKVQDFRLGELSLIFLTKRTALLLPIQPFLPGVRTEPATDQTSAHLPVSLSVPGG